MNANKQKLLLATVVMTGCSQYADFTLPAPDASGPRAPFTWQASPQPVLSRGPEMWDSVDVLNPSVFRFQGALWNLYSGFDGQNWSTGTAVSPDGIIWKKTGRVLSGTGASGQGSNGSALFENRAEKGVENGEIFYWYVSGDPPAIALARSRDGVKFETLKNLVVPVGPRGSFDERGAADPYVIRRGDYLYLFYLGQDRARRQTLGVARSRDGVEWEKSRANPLLELGAPGSFDENGLGEPAVWTSGGFYWMLYTGRDRAEHRRLGLARSPDGVHWEREPSFTPVEGEQPWDDKVVCDPTVLLEGETLRVWFGGGDVAHPVANIHGQIGYATLRGR
jgi:predicted GH43/DUF377 family glycosyl hydrolase